MTKNKKEKNLKLYVWENVLTDWTDGIMFALATSPEHARKLLLKKCPNLEYSTEDLNLPPKLVSEPEGFVVWGGG